MSKVSNKYKSLSIKDLQASLVDLEKERLSLETKMLHSEGSSKRVRNYPSKEQLNPFGNIRNVKKEIAVVKTFLNVKLGGGL